MKKTIFFLLFCNVCTIVPAQDKDSLEWAEMKRLNRMGDSLYKLRLAKESAYLVKMEESLRKTQQGIAQSKQKEVEQLTEQVLAQHRKEQRRKRMAAILTIAAFGIATIIGALIARRRKQEKIRRQQYY